jgi:phosphoribosylamine---glycine ligase
MARRGHPFRGVLYAGLMMTSSGPKVLEYNTRFGDPETQAVLPRLKTDLVDLFEAASRPGGLASLGDSPVEFRPDWAVTVVLASAGYPASSSKGDLIEGLEEAAATAEVIHAGTSERDGMVFTAGGRVLNLTGLGRDAATARQRAYDAAEAITFEGKQMRSDIADRAVERTG